MCGIVGYIGNKPVYDILINGLKKLEYRGYDSSGVMIYDDKLLIKKSKGKVSALESLFVNEKDKNGTLGIGHTRWATHGPPNQVNSHPHVSNSEEISLVHNGIIENYDSIKKILVKNSLFTKKMKKRRLFLGFARVYPLVKAFSHKNTFIRFVRFKKRF